MEDSPPKANILVVDDTPKLSNLRYRQAVSNLI